MKNNPYIGPRPFERSDRDRFFGRARETRDLLSLIMAERVVLFYAQSGAGKTSLLNTQIIPALEEEGFHVLPVARVGGELLPGLPDAAVKNIFVFSVWLGLMGQDTPLTTLTGDNLVTAIKNRWAAAPHDEFDESRPPVLIIDQFEEILTTHRNRWQDARGFFAQLAEALEKMPRLGIVLAMREDFVAGLDPYAPLLPKRLKARFRMERLGYAGALEAIKNPAASAQVPFAAGVAEQLVDELRRIKADDLGGQESETVLGPYVEPVQLQVVCSQLWAKLPEQADHEISQADVRDYGNVDQALIGFYESCVQRTAEAAQLPERALRRWFAEKLITPMQTRGLVLRGKTETAGLSNAAVDHLESAHLISTEVRAGARWYEISHDRLVDPIVNSNAAWEQTRMTPLRATAQNWQQRKNANLLYRGRALLEAQRWATAHSVEMEDYEQDFLEASDQHAKARKRRTMTVVTTVGAVILMILGLLGQSAALSAIEAGRQADNARQQAMLAATAEANSLKAEQQARLARAGQLASQAQAVYGSFYERGLLLAVEALKSLQASDPPANSVSDTMRQLLGDKAGISLNENNESVTAAVFRPDASELATGSADGTVRLWDLRADLTNAQATVLSGTVGERIFALAYSPDGRLLAAGNDAGQIMLWNLSETTPPDVITVDAPISAIAISPDGRALFAAMLDGTVSGWDISSRSSPKLLVRLRGHTDGVTAVAVSPDARWLATGSRDQTVAVWDSAMGKMLARLRYDDGIRTVAFSPDGLWLATGTDGGAVRLWDMASSMSGQTSKSIDLKSNGNTTGVVEFSPDARWLSAQTRKGTTLIWNMSDLTAAPMEEGSQGQGVLIRLTSPDQQWMMTATTDKATLWPLNPNELIWRACAAAGRNLTRTEWTRYFSDQPYRQTCDQWPLEDSGQ